MENAFLFGFDLFAIAVSLWKLLTTDVFPEFNEKIKRLILALLMTGASVVVGLQSLGVILPPESEPVATLVLTAIMVFLGVMGYGETVIGVSRAVVDLIRLGAVNAWKRHGVDEAQLGRVATLLVKYRMIK